MAASEDEKKYLDKDGLLYVKQKINNKFVEKESGKGLSTNDFTNEKNTKLTNIEDGAEVNTIETIKVNGTAQSISSKEVDIIVPTNNNQLDNGAGYQTANDVNTAIQNAIAGLEGISYEVVNTLPATGEAGVIYLISNSGTNPNSYDEYIYINNAFEKIGTTDVDLTDYVKEEDLVAITNAEIDAIFNN